MLAAYVGASLRALQLELDKVFTYGGDTAVITADHISAVVGMSREYSVFELQKAAGQREVRRALEVLEHMMNAGENVPFLIVMLCSYMTALWKLQDLQARRVPERELAAAARVHPYFLREYLDAARKFSRAELETGLVLLADADEKVKTGKGDHREIMCDLIVRLLSDGEHVS
jgi:DNA polymerase-3 subunit delta